MPCTCNAICDNDCGSNQLCTGHVPACGSNNYNFTSVVSVGGIIRALHIFQLEDAINQERINGVRRFNSGAPAYCFTHTPGNVACSNNTFAAWSFPGDRGVDDVVFASHFTNVKDANNNVTSSSGYGGTVTDTFVRQADDVSVGKVDSIITAADIASLQTIINQTRTTCICDSHCNCDPSDCGCNGECPSDDYYYYYYYYY